MKNTPPAYGLSAGPMMVACQWNKSSPTGPAEQSAGQKSSQGTADQHRYTVGHLHRLPARLLHPSQVLQVCICVVAGLSIVFSTQGTHWLEGLSSDHPAPS